LGPREPAIFSLRVFDERFNPSPAGLTDVTILWTSPGGQTQERPAQEIQPGVFSIELTGLSPGTHWLKALAKLRGRPWGEDRLRFHWASAPPELPMDQKWLREVAELSGGSMQEISAAEATGLLGRLPPARREFETRRRLQPWASPIWLGLTAAAFLAEWGLRRLKGHC
jgi:hypothetical protein